MVYRIRYSKGRNSKGGGRNCENGPSERIYVPLALPIFVVQNHSENESDVVPNFLNSGPGLNFLFLNANLFCTFKCLMICIICPLL